MQTNPLKLDIKVFWRRLWTLISPSHREIKKLVVLIIFIELSRLIGPFVLKLAIDEITQNQLQHMAYLFGLVVAMFFSNQIVSWFAYFDDKKIVKILVGIEEYLPTFVHQKMLYMDLSYHERENTGNKIVKVQRGTDKIIELLANVFWEVTPTTFQIVFTTIILFLVDWRFGLVISLFVPVFVVLTLKINREVHPLRRTRFDKQEEAAGVMSQSIININTVKSFVQEEREVRQMKKIRQKINEINTIEWKKFLSFNLGRNFVIDSGRIMMFLFGIFLVWKGAMTVGSLVFVYTISEKALLSLFRISRLYDRIMESGEAVQRLYDISVQTPDITNPQNGFKPKKIEGKIEFKGVTFRYSESKILALSNVSVKINSGCMTALVGPSGGGKTTMARMVYRHYDPSTGQVLLDGKDLRQYDLYKFRSYISIVPQEVEIFNTTIKENISYSRPNASIEEIQAAAKIANAQEFILQMKEKYNTLVGERGIKLSGGQRQRLGIARAILANPKILIFDEATSSLDSYSERLIQQAMDKISKGRTVIVIAHRLSTIQKADKIIVLEKGKVVEEGSHIELAKTQGGLYQKLLSLQQMGDVE